MKLGVRNLALGVLVVLLGALNLLLVPDREPSTEVRRLFPTLDLESAERIRLEAAGGDGVTLERAEDDLWRVVERAGARAFEPTVEQLLRGLAAATDAEREATSASSHAQLGVDSESAGRILVEGEGGQVLVDVRQGAAPDGSRGSRLVRAGEDAVYRASTVPQVLAEPRRWTDADVLPFDPRTSPALRLETRAGDGTWSGLRLERREDGRFTTTSTEGGELRLLPPARVDPLLRALDSLVAQDLLTDEDPGARDAGPPAQEFTLRIEFEPGLETMDAPAGTLWLGHAPSGPELEALGGGALRALRVGLDPNDALEARWLALPRASEARLRAAIASLR